MAALHARLPPHVNLWSCWVETTAHLFIVMISHSCFTSGVHSGYLYRHICLVSDTTSTSSSNHNVIMTTSSSITCMKLKEVLRRENQGLKVYPVDGSPVFSMTGNYFWFVLSMLSGWIKKNRPRPVRSFAVTPPVQSNNFKIPNPPVVGWRQVLCMTPFPQPESKKKQS